MTESKNIDEQTKKEIIKEYEDKKKKENYKAKERKERISYVSIGSLVYFFVALGLLLYKLDNPIVFVVSLIVMIYSIYQLVRVIKAEKLTVFEQVLFIFINLIPYIIVKICVGMIDLFPY